MQTFERPYWIAGFRDLHGNEFNRFTKQKAKGKAMEFERMVPEEGSTIATMMKVEREH